MRTGKREGRIGSGWVDSPGLAVSGYVVKKGS